MALGFFVRTGPGRAPRGVDRHLWYAASRNAPFNYEGPTEVEPWVACRLAELRHELTRQHHEDVTLASAHRSRDQATLRYQTAEASARQVDEETAPLIEPGQLGRAIARPRGQGQDQGQDARRGTRRRSERARAFWRRDRAYELRDTAHGAAQLETLGFQAASGALTDRMHVRATAAVARMYAYVVLLNQCRFKMGFEPLAPLAADLADRAVLDAVRRPNDPPLAGAVPAP